MPIESSMPEVLKSWWHLALLTVLWGTGLCAQQLNFPLNRGLQDFHQAAYSLNESDSILHTSFQPLLVSQMPEKGSYNSMTYIPVSGNDSFLSTNAGEGKSWMHRKLFLEDLLILDTGKVYFTINPLFDLSRGQRNARDGFSTYTNTRGLLLRGNVGKKFSVESYVYENQARFPDYIRYFVNDRDVVPGQGRVKEFKDSTSFDFSQSGGYISYSPVTQLNIQFGHHKHFIGDGYRSLLLSDNSFSYPFLRLSGWLVRSRLQYTVLYAGLQNQDRLPNYTNSEPLFARKGGVFHYANYVFSKKVQVGLFQGMIWKTMDENGQRVTDVFYYNPIIFLSALRYGLDDENNALVGLNFKIKPIKRLKIYGQGVIDDNKIERTAWQLGAQALVSKQLLVRLEHNRIAPKTYGYEDNPSQSYTHHAQELAHPQGSGLSETLVQLQYRYQRWIFAGQWNITAYDTYNSYKEVWGESRDQLGMGNVQLSYLVNPATNMKLSLGWGNRNLDGVNIQQESEQMIFLRFHTDLTNIYYDF